MRQLATRCDMIAMPGTIEIAYKCRHFRRRDVAGSCQGLQGVAWPQYGWGARGRKFESCRPDQFNQRVMNYEQAGL
jgi:hypothetical protein